MEQVWYARRGNREVGPISRSMLEQSVKAGRLSPCDYVRKEGETEWRLASEVIQFPSLWMVRRGDEDHGPLSSEQIRNLSVSGKLKPTDLVRYGNSEWEKASAVTGLFLLSNSIALDQANEKEVPAPTSNSGIKQCWIFLVIVSLPLLFLVILFGHLFTADTSDTTVATSSSSSDGDDSSASSIECGQTDDAVELIAPTFIIDPEYAFNGIYITNNAEYLFLGERELWHIPTSTRIQLPDMVNDASKWLSAAISPDGRYLAAAIAQVDTWDRSITRTQLRVFSLNKNDVPKQIASLDLKIPSELSKIFESSDVEIPLNYDMLLRWKKVMWSDDCSTICVASEFAANVVTNWQKQASIYPITHPNILSYSGKSSDFSDFVNLHRENYLINSVSCAPDGSHTAVCYKRGGIEVHSTETKKRHFLTFPKCLTEWIYERAYFSPDGKFIATVIQQESGRVRQQRKNVFHTSRHWFFIEDTDSLREIARFGPDDNNSPNRSWSPGFIGWLGNGTSFLMRHTSEFGPTLLVVDSQTSKVLRQFVPPDEGRGCNVFLNTYANPTASYHTDGPIKILSAESGKVSHAILRPELLTNARELAVSNDSTVIAVRYNTCEVGLFGAEKSIPLDANKLKKGLSKVHRFVGQKVAKQISDVRTRTDRYVPSPVEDGSSPTFPSFQRAEGSWVCRKTGVEFYFEPAVVTGKNGEKMISKSVLVKHETAPYRVTKTGKSVDEKWSFDFHENGYVYASPIKNVDNPRSRIGKFTFDGKLLSIKLALTASCSDLGKIPWEYDFELVRP